MSILPRNSKDFRRIIGNFEDMKRITILLVTFIVASCGKTPQLERRYEELPLGAIKPAGWLKETLIRQRDWPNYPLEPCETVELVPYGCTKLRISEFSVL